MSPFRKKLVVWIYRALMFVLGAVVMAVATLFGSSVLGAADWTLRQVGVACVTAGAISLAAFMKKEPLPELTENDL